MSNSNPNMDGFSMEQDIPQFDINQPLPNILLDSNPNTDTNNYDSQDYNNINNTENNYNYNNM